MEMVSKRFIVTLLTLAIIGIGTAVAIFMANGYKYSSKTGTFSGTGIISITTVPDQASVYIDGHLTTASNANITSLLPKTYSVRISKDGYIDWDKNVEVKEGLVSQIKATLFPAIPTVYPLSFNGVMNVTQSPDTQRFAYIVRDNPQDDQSVALGVSKKSGIWVWEMNSSALSFSLGPEPHRIAALTPGVDYTRAKLEFSPDSSQILLSLDNQSLLLDENKFNDPPRDITAILGPTLKGWEDEIKTKNMTKISSLKDSSLRQEASGAALIKWSPDETKFFYSQDGKDNYKLVDLVDKHHYDLPKANLVEWLPDSRHLVLVEDQEKPASSPNLGKQDGQDLLKNMVPTKISVLEFDGSNKDEIYVGNLDQSSVLAWPDSSKLVFVSAFPTATANHPNLFGVNLK